MSDDYEDFDVTIRMIKGPGSDEEDDLKKAAIFAGAALVIMIVGGVLFFMWSYRMIW